MGASGGEGVKAYEAFSVYLELGEERSIRAVAKQLNKSTTLIGRWSRAYQWVERTAAYDVDVQRKAHAQAVKKRRKMADRHISIALKLQEKALQALKDMDPSEIDRRTLWRSSERLPSWSVRTAWSWRPIPHRARRMSRPTAALPPSYPRRGNGGSSKMNLTSDAILYYADNPVDFVEDIIRAKPDSNQRANPEQRSSVPHDLCTLRPRHRQERGGELACYLVPDYQAISQDTLHRPHPAPAMGHPVGRDCEMAPQ